MNKFNKENCKYYVQNEIRNIALRISPCFDDIGDIENINKDELKHSIHEFYNFYQYVVEEIFNNPQLYNLTLKEYPKEAWQYDKELREYLCASKIKEPDKKYLLSHNGFNIKARKEVYKLLDDIFITEESEYFVKEKQENTNMILAYECLKKVCLENKKLRHLFYRCDFRALEEGFKWTFSDLIYSLPKEIKEQLIDLNLFLKSNKYKSKLEYENVFAYTINNKVILRFYVEADILHLYFRWILYKEDSARFFEILHQESPEICQKIYENIIKCRTDCVPGYGADSPEHCGENIYIEYNGRNKNVCMGTGLQMWDCRTEDFESVMIVARIFAKLILEKK